MLKQSAYNLINKLPFYVILCYWLRFNYQQAIHCLYIPIRDILNSVLRLHKHLLLYIVIVDVVGAKRFPLLMIHFPTLTRT